MKMNLQRATRKIRHLTCLFFMTLFATLMSSCGSKNDSTESARQSPAKTSNPCDSMEILAADTAITPLKLLIEPLPPNSAAELMTTFLAKTQLYDLATDYSYGGEFPASMFNISAGDGILMWFCYDKSTNQFFLALESYTEKKYRDNITNLPRLAQTNKLSKPVHTFKYPKATLSDPHTLENLLKTHKETIGITLAPADSIEINKLIKNFRTISSPYVKYGFSFITENQVGDLAQFAASAGTNGYVRYYFGYEEIDPLRGRIVPNKIRIVLATADATGKSRVGAVGAGTVIQSSWPPPPWN